MGCVLVYCASSVMDCQIFSTYALQNFGRGGEVVNFTYIDIYLSTKETTFCLPGEYKKDELLESARYACLEDIWNLVIFSELYVLNIYIGF